MMLKIQNTQIKKRFVLLLIISTAIRILLAGIFELSNDEVYYWLYAKFPDISHFDHPPMVGLVIQFFSLNLFFDSELAIRFSAIVFSTLNTGIIFNIGTRFFSERTGYFAALLYTASIYASIMAGAFILPDTPQLLFWLLALWLYLEAFNANKKSSWAYFLSAGFFAALAISSKYHSAFIPFGVAIYVLFKDQKWLKHPAFYVSLFIAACGFAPTLIWNIQNEFASFAFHGNRVTPGYKIRLDLFAREILGQMAYNNPINYVLLLTALITFFKSKEFRQNKNLQFLIFNGLPLIILFTGFSLFRKTLPHWSGPGFLPLLLVAGYYCDKRCSKQRSTPLILQVSNYMIALLAFVAIYVINFSPLQFGKTTPAHQLGNHDFTLDMYGWKQISRQFKDLKETENLPDYDFVALKWFPGTHTYYYLANSYQANVFVLGSINASHKYAWFFEENEGLKKGKNYFHLGVSNYYRNPEKHFSKYFSQVVPLDTFEVYRGDVLLRNAVLYECKNYYGNFVNPLPK